MTKNPPDDERNRLLRAVGNSPLVRLALPSLPPNARLFAKLETTNPGGSLKDRPVLRMMQSALAAGKLEGGRRLLDAVGSNGAISYAMFGAALGVPITLVMPADTSRDLLDRIRAHGAETVLSDGGLEAATADAHQLFAASAERFYFCDHANNDDNWLAHYETTGHEILAQLFDAIADEPDAWVMGVGSGATLYGVAKKLRRRRPDLHVAAAVPASGQAIQGLRALPGRGPCFDPGLVNQTIPVTAADAHGMCLQLAGLGHFVGPSSGAHVAAACALLAEGRARTAVTVLCDNGERYGGGFWRRSAPRRADHHEKTRRRPKS